MVREARKKWNEFSNALKVGWFLAVRQLVHSGKGTTSLIIFIMVLTFLNLVVVSGLLTGLIVGSFKQFRESYSGEVIITSAQGRDYIEHSRELISFLNNHPKVERISPRITTSGQILGTLTDNPDKNERANKIGARLVGIDPVREEALTGFSRFVIKGEPLKPGEEGYILAAGNLLRKYSSFGDVNIPGLDLLDDVDVGSRVRVTITGPSSSSIGKGRMRITAAEGESTTVTKEFIVKGIVKSKVDEISTRFFVTDKELKRIVPIHKEEVQEIAVRTDYEYAPQLVEQIKGFMEGYAARIQTTDEAIPSFLRDIEATMVILGNALSSIALVVASITIFIVIFINAVTRRKFIGIMKGIGISPGAIKTAYVFQALFYGITGSIIGLLLTFGALRPFFDAYPINFPFSDGILVVTVAGAAVRVAILLSVTLIAGYIPAMLIVRRNTLDAILGR